MKAEIVINKIVITAEAAFDYATAVVNVPMPKTAIKNESEFYIDNLNNGGRLLYDNYFRAKYYDEQSDKMLMLFFYRGERFSTMQLWKLSGICVADDWTEELEDSGQIRYWLKSKIGLSDEPKTDWVWTLRLYETEQKRLIEESDNENYGEDYMDIVKRLIKNYKVNKMRIAVGNYDDMEVVELADKVEFLEKCIGNLDDEDKTLMSDVVLKGLSLKKAGEKYGFSKTGLQYRRDRAMKLLEIMFKERYDG